MKKKAKEADLGYSGGNKQSKGERVGNSSLMKMKYYKCEVGFLLVVVCWMLKISIYLYGGLLVGRITEVTGLEQSGKSLLSKHLLGKNTETRWSWY